jgi:hypothetical protein
MDRHDIRVDPRDSPVLMAMYLRAMKKKHKSALRRRVHKNRPKKFVSHKRSNALLHSVEASRRLLGRRGGRLISKH